MVIKCIATTLSSTQKNSLPPEYQNSDFHITESKEYIVLGITIHAVDNAPPMCLVDIVSDYQHLSIVPLVLFEITNPVTSKYWTFSVRDNGSIAFYPKEFLRNFFHDDLSEDAADVVKDFIRIRDLIHQEALLKW